MFAKVVSNYENVQNDILFIRLSNGFHLNESVINEFYGRLLRLYRYSDKDESPICSVYAVVYTHDNKCSHFVDTSSSDSFNLNKKYGISIDEKPGNPAKWDRKLLEQNIFPEKGEIELLGFNGFKTNMRLKAKLLGWKSYMPIYVFDANNSRISGVIMIMSSEDVIFSNAKPDYKEKLIKNLMEVISVEGTQRAMEPRYFLDNIDLKKINQERQLDLLTISTIVTGAYTLSPIKLMSNLDFAIAKVGLSIDNMVAVGMLGWNIAYAIHSGKLRIKEKANDNLNEGILNDQLISKYELEKSIVNTESSFLISEYVRTEIEKIQDAARQSYSNYIKNDPRFGRKSFKRQIRTIIGKFKNYSLTDEELRKFVVFLRKNKKLKYSGDKYFSHYAFQEFLTREAKILKENNINSHDLIEQDYHNIAKAIFFRNTANKRSIDHNLRMESYKVLTEKLNLRVLARSIDSYESFEKMVKEYADFPRINALRLKLIACSKKKYRKEKIILNILRGKIEKKVDDKVSISIMEKIENDLKNNFLYYGIFEKRYKLQVVKPYSLDEAEHVFADIRTELNRQTKKIADLSLRLLIAYDSFFTEDNLNYFINLKFNDQEKFYKNFIKAALHKKIAFSEQKNELIYKLYDLK